MNPLCNGIGRMNAESIESALAMVKNGVSVEQIVRNECARRGIDVTSLLNQARQCTGLAESIRRH